MAENIKQYKLTSRIATGGTGAVYRGRNSETKSDVAIKVFNPDIAGNPSLRKRFVSNVSRLQALKHENIVQILDAIEESDGLFMVMDYAPGKPLSSLLGGRARPLSPEIAVPYISQVLRALSHAHSANKRHGALKPTDVIIGSDSRIRVEGFGVAELAGQGNVLRAASRAGMLPYFAPEQLRHSTQLDAKADVYSAGIMLYHLLTGVLPFAPTSASSEAQVRSAIVKKPLPDSPVFENLPPALVDVVRRATAKQREDRPTARDFLRVLQQVPAPQTQRAMIAGAAGATVAGAVAGAAAEQAAKRVSISTAPPVTGAALRPTGEQERLYAPPTPSGLQDSSTSNAANSSVAAASAFAESPKSAEKQPPSDEAAAQLREVLKNAAPQNVSPQAASQSALVEQRMRDLRTQDPSSSSGAVSSGAALGMVAGAAAGTAFTASSDTGSGHEASSLGTGAMPDASSGGTLGEMQSPASSLMPMDKVRRFDDTAPPSANAAETKERKGSGLGALLAGGAIAGILIGGTYWYFTFRNETPAKKAEQAALSQEERMKYFKDSLANAPEIHADWRDTVEPGTPLYDSLDKAERAAKALTNGSPPASANTESSTASPSSPPSSSSTPEASNAETSKSSGKESTGGLPSIFGGKEKDGKKKSSAQGDENSPLNAIKKASAEAMKKSSGTGSSGVNGTKSATQPTQQSSQSGSQSGSQAPSSQTTSSQAPSSQSGSQSASQRPLSSVTSSSSRPTTTPSAMSAKGSAKESAKERAAAEKQARADRLKQERAERIAARRASVEAKRSTKREAKRNASESSTRTSSARSSNSSKLSSSSASPSSSRKRNRTALYKGYKNNSSRSSSRSFPRNLSHDSSRDTEARRSATGIAERTPDEMASAVDKSDVLTLRGHLGAVQSVSFSPDGKLLASGGTDKTVKIWDVATGKIIRSMRGHAKGVTTVFFSPDGKYVMSGSKDKTVKVWNVDTGERMQSTAGITCSGSPTAFSPDGTLLATTRSKLITLAKIHPKSSSKSQSNNGGK
jgi:serine/threonine-protein kinase